MEGGFFWTYISAAVSLYVFMNFPTISRRLEPSHMLPNNFLESSLIPMPIMPTPDIPIVFITFCSLFSNLSQPDGCPSVMTKRYFRSLVSSASSLVASSMASGTNERPPLFSAPTLDFTSCEYFSLKSLMILNLLSKPYSDHASFLPVSSFAASATHNANSLILSNFNFMLALQSSKITHASSLLLGASVSKTSVVLLSLGMALIAYCILISPTSL